MAEPERGSDRLGRRAKRFLSPTQQYQVWLQLVRGETTISQAADHHGSTAGPSCGCARSQGRRAAGAGRVRAGCPAGQAGLELEAARAEAARLGEAVKELAVKLMLVEEKGRWG